MTGLRRHSSSVLRRGGRRLPAWRLRRRRERRTSLTTGCPTCSNRKMLILFPIRCLAPARKRRGAANPALPVIRLMTADAIRAAAADFKNCIANLWPDAARRGITRENYDRFTAGLTPTCTSWTCSTRSRNSPRRRGTISISWSATIASRAARRCSPQYASAFSAMQRSYGVDPAIIAAIWGVESNYSTLGGTRPVLRSTATLACVGRRRDYFREEFLSTLDILQRGDVPADHLHRLLGRRVRPDAIHADHVQALCGRLRRRRPSRHCQLGAGPDRFDRQQSETGRLGAGPDLGLRSRAAAEFRLHARRPL